MLSRLITLRWKLQNARSRSGDSEAGATAVEYGLMVALIAVVVHRRRHAPRGNLSSLFNTVATKV